MKGTFVYLLAVTLFIPSLIVCAEDTSVCKVQNTPSGYFKTHTRGFYRDGGRDSFFDIITPKRDPFSTILNSSLSAKGYELVTEADAESMTFDAALMWNPMIFSSFTTGYSQRFKNSFEVGFVIMHNGKKVLEKYYRVNADFIPDPDHESTNFERFSSIDNNPYYSKPTNPYYLIALDSEEAAINAVIADNLPNCGSIREPLESIR